MDVKALIVSVLVVLILGCLWAIPTFLLWNWIIVLLFKLPEVTIWQALGLNILSSIFFRREGN